MKTQTLLIGAGVAVVAYLIYQKTKTPATPEAARVERRIRQADQVQTLREQMMKRIGAEFWG